MTPPLVSIRGLTVRYGSVGVLEGLSMDIQEGEILGLVGESGSGKTTLARSLMQLIAVEQGSILYRQESLVVGRRFRWPMQMIFQDPYTSLDPQMTVAEIVAEPIYISGRNYRPPVDDRVAELLAMVGLDPLVRFDFPREFSGGQRQRIAIARALAAEPEFLVADEPLSALDVSVQAQILNLIMDLQRRLKLTVLFVSHDLRALYHICDRVAVIHRGKILEIAPAEQLFERPVSPYTRALLSATQFISDEI